MVLGNVGGGEAVILGKARIYAENKHAETEQPETGNNERVTGDGGAGEPDQGSQYEPGPAPDAFDAPQTPEFKSFLNGDILI